MNPKTRSLPVISAAPEVPTWQGLRPAGANWGDASAAPEPVLPQGEYAETEFSVDLAPGEPNDRPVELLSPAGGPDAAFAAFHHGADAIYLGLKKFSARAEAENFTLDEVNEVTAYAHSLSPVRRVFVTINTLVRQDELPELIADLAALDDIGVDALIVQDLGVAKIVRDHFPSLELHASTQLAVHNRAGAQALGRFGFTRVVLARELTFEEVRDITSMTDIKTEVFVHGALCYSYSGLCLFSAQTLGRSGNRGKCVYSCRHSYEVAGAPETLRDGTLTRRDPHTGFPFSMKDLALPDHLPALRAAGVSCFKIEGRKKSPLYVATTTSYYRGLIEGSLPASERPAREAELQTVFSRPWTKLFVQSHQDKEVADRDTVGHRGTFIGTVEQVTNGKLSFVTSRALERHDGLQVDLPILSKPFGFPVDRLWVIDGGGKRREVLAAPAGSHLEVALPIEHPNLPKAAPVYCSSSQDVKQRFRFDRPKAGMYRVRHPIDVRLIVSEGEVVVEGALAARSLSKRDLQKPLFALRAHVVGNFPPARDPEQLQIAARSAFEKLGETELCLGELTIENPLGLFVPVSKLNQLRRDLVSKLADNLQSARKQVVEQVTNLVTHARSISDDATQPSKDPFRWSLKVDRLGFVEAFEDADWANVDEIIIDIARDSVSSLVEQAGVLGNRLGRDRIRFALPAITRKWEEKAIIAKIAALRKAGWSKWEAANLSAWEFLGVDPANPKNTGIDLATDWSVYVLNRSAALAAFEMGARRFALSPEDGRANVRSLLGEFAAQAVLIVYQDTPQFIAESCAYANLIGGCPGKPNCSFESMDMVSSHGERITALDYHCRTIVLNQGPYCLAPRLKELAKLGARNLRADFIYQRYSPTDVRDRWRLIRAGRNVPGGHSANFDIGLL
ncbi:MAG: peptidase U32 family protein [Gemmataceae bacterium]